MALSTFTTSEGETNEVFERFLPIPLFLLLPLLYPGLLPSLGLILLHTNPIARYRREDHALLIRPEYQILVYAAMADVTTLQDQRGVPV